MPASRPAPGDAPPRVDGPSPTPIASLIGHLLAAVTSLESHVTAMNYLGTDEFDANVMPGHPFDEKVWQELHALAGRVEQLSNDLYSADQERRCYSTLTSAQQSQRTQEFEQLADDARTARDE